jgi:transposase-like protein
VFTVVSDSADRESAAAWSVPGSSSVIDEIVREGARRMLAEALQAEVDAYIAQFADVRDESGHRLVVRNGSHAPRDVLTSAGSVQAIAPRVNDKRVDAETGERRRFSSAILPPWARKTPKIGEVLPLLYLHGLSTGDFVPALGQFLGSAKGLSSSTVTRLTETWKSEARAFAERDLSGVDFVYLWADGIHVKVRLERDKLCLLVMIGVRADGRKELVALADGYRESTGSWAIYCVTANAAACARRCWRSVTGRSGSGARCARCSRTPASSAAGSIKYRMFLLRCRSRRTLARRRRSPRSGTPRTNATPWKR